MEWKRIWRERKYNIWIKNGTGGVKEYDYKGILKFEG